MIRNMETEQIHANDEHKSSSHKLFRGIMLSFLFTLIIFGYISAFAQTPEEQVKEVLEIDEDIVLPTDGLRYSFKKITETFREILTFDKENKEKLNIEIADERAKEMAVLSARGERIPNDVVIDYNKRIEQASRLISLRTDQNTDIETRSTVRAALEEHLTEILNKVETDPSNTNLGRIISDFRQEVMMIIANIDQEEVDIVKNTIPIVQQKQTNIKLAEMVGDAERVRQEVAELEEIDDKLNRLHLAEFCDRPIKTLSLTSFEDIKENCPMAEIIEDEIRTEFTNSQR